MENPFFFNKKRKVKISKINVDKISVIFFYLAFEDGLILKCGKFQKDEKW